MTKRLSIIIPVYNESKRLKNSWEKIKKYFLSKNYLAEIIFVNDGSLDNSLLIIKKFKAKFPIKIITYPKNQGKGFAIRKGVLAASGKIILFMDIDLSTPLEMTENFLNEFEENTLLIGNRESPQSKLIKRQSFFREKMGRIFTLLSNLILRDNCSDYTCGFKIFPTNLGKKIFSKAKINRWAFDAELIFLAKKMGIKVKELPVVWEHKGNSRVNLKKDILYTFFELLKIRYYGLRGNYN